MRSKDLNTPWVVVYETDWRDQTVKRQEDDGSFTVAFIDDCDGNHVIQTDCGVYFMHQQVAEFLVKCVNERAKQYAV